MVGSHKNGNPRKERFLFDIITKHYELKNIDAQPIDIPDLIEYYNRHHPVFTTFYDTKERKKNLRLKKKRRSGTEPCSSDISSYDLVTFFIEHQISVHENSSFILDEVPIFQQKGNFHLNVIVRAAQ